MGIANGQRVKVSSNRGYIKAVALVTAAARADDRRQDRAPRGHPDPLGLRGHAKPGFLTNTLTPFVGDGNSQTPEFKSFLVNVEKA